MRQPILYILTLAFLLTTAGEAYAAKTFTKRYKGERREAVLEDLGEATGYTYDMNPAELDMSKPVTATFKKASVKSVLRKVLGKDATFTIGKGVIHIKGKPIPPVITERPAAQADTIIDNDSLTLLRWRDTVETIDCRWTMRLLDDQPDIVPPAPDSHALKGHHLQGWLGAGYGSMGYGLRAADGTAVGTEHGSFAGLAQLNYAYYFTDNWGIAAGVGFSNYCSYGTLNHTKQWEGQTDTDGETYTHIARTHDWRERQAAYMVDIPVMVQMQYPVAERLRVYAGAGVKIGLPVAADWSIRTGQLEHQGYYQRWNLTLDAINARDFYTEQAADFGTDKHNLALRLPAVGAMAEAGVAYPIRAGLDLIAGVFFNYTCNNLRPEDGPADGNMGWQQTGNTGAEAYRNHDFMPAYGGEVMSEYVQALHPWAVGVKVGISWHHVKKKKPKVYYERLLHCDTITDLHERFDTVYKPRPAAVQQIVRLMQKSVIWFDLDSSEPKLEPADILDRIAAILRENPDQKILVYGHASREGNEQYNQRLSDRRAKAVTDMLLEKGVRPEQISQRGFAASIAYEQGEHAISLDRRVEIIPVLEEQ